MESKRKALEFNFASFNRIEPVSEINDELVNRLTDIAAELAGESPGANGKEFWFSPRGAEGLQLRFSPPSFARGFARSTNFSISYQLPKMATHGAEEAALRSLVDRIQRVDTTPIEDVARDFAVAAERAVVCLLVPLQDAVATGLAAEGARQPDAPSASLRTYSRSWERDETRQLNVIFCDLCAQLIRTGNQALPSLHWGFWPVDVAGQPVHPEGYDPFEAFSENLLGYLPPEANRILDVGCGLGANARWLSRLGRSVTAISPVAEHCDIIASAKLPGVEVRCARFEEMVPEPSFDLLLFSESLNHFPLGDEFLMHCRRFLREEGFLLMADDLSEERAVWLERQKIFRLITTVDISRNVAPMTQWWESRMRTFEAYRSTLRRILQMQDPDLIGRIDQAIAAIDSSELRQLLSGDSTPPATKGRYMIYLLQAPASPK